MSDIPGRQVPSHSADAAAPLAPTPTWACHWETQHPGWQGMWTGAGHLCSGTQWIGYLGTERDKPEVDMPQQPAGYNVRRAAARPSHANGEQGGVGFGPQDQIS